jgi:hypothetical protein
MTDSVETLASIFRECGVLTGADMDDANIVDMTEDSRKTRKDERVLYPQRAVLMNSVECVHEYKEYQQRLQAKKAPTGRVGTPGKTKATYCTKVGAKPSLIIEHEKKRPFVRLLGAKLVVENKKPPSFELKDGLVPSKHKKINYKNITFVSDACKH